MHYFACCCWIEGGAEVTGGKAVWEGFVFRYLYPRYPASEVSVAGQLMMVEAASMMTMRTLVETLDLLSDYVNARLRHFMLF